MNDFEQAAYNKHEHNHTEWPTERLTAESKRLSEHLNSMEHHPIRKKQIQHQLGLIAMEIYCRRKETGR